MADLLSNTISCLWPWCAPRIKDSCELQENVRILSVLMDELKEVRDDVQRIVDDAEADSIEPKKRNDEVDGWLKRVQNFEGEVEKILQKVDELQINRGRCLGGFCPPNNCWSTYKLGQSIAEKIPVVEQLKGKGHFEVVAYRLPPPSVRYMNLQSTVGMESMFDKVWRLITSKDGKVVRIMGLHGQGGVGKTTLLQKINNEFKKISEYEHVLYVVVSKPVNYEAIQNKIGERLGLSNLLKGDGDVNSRAQTIFNKLDKTNFVLMLDDIWETVDLKRIGVPRPQGNSSKVIFTTRYKEVCGPMDATHKFQVECLPWDQAWTLFQKKVGNESLSSHPEIPELAELVAEECDGLPLALNIIGRAMSTRKSVEEWKDALTTLRNSTSEFPGMSEEVFPRLKLSYDYLGNDRIKSCFLYCALYPEDHNIYTPILIDYWIGEGFFNEFDNLDEARIRAHAIVETLKRACLLESEIEHLVKMHDIIRDLALWIVNDCKSSSSSNKMDKFLVESNNITCEKWENAERIFWMVPRDGIYYELEKPPASPNLLTLMVIGNGSESAPNFSLLQFIFQFTSSLGVLDLSRIKLTEFPTSICELHKLQYLGLSFTNITELPVELRNLVKLKFLDLTATLNLIKIPPGLIANLSELRVLRLYASGFKGWELKEEDGSGLSFCELDRLKKFQAATLTINTSLTLEKFMCYQKLLMICTTLEIKNCINLKAVSLPPPSLSSSSSTIISVDLGKLTNLEQLYINEFLELEELTLFINDDTEINAQWHNNNKIETLFLCDLPRLNNIVWEKYDHYMAAPQPQQYLHNVSPFQNLHEIFVSDCNALKDLTWLVYVENLKNFNLSSCEELETIIELGDDGLEETAGGGVFGRLETLSLVDLPKLESICKHSLALPFITTIEIVGCPELKKLPLDSNSNVNNTLRWIEGETEWWNELKWEDETAMSKFLPYYQRGEYEDEDWDSEDEDEDDDFEDLENSDDGEEWEDSDDDFEDQANSNDVEDQANSDDVEEWEDSDDDFEDQANSDDVARHVMKRAFLSKCNIGRFTEEFRSF